MDDITAQNVENVGNILARLRTHLQEGYFVLVGQCFPFQGLDLSLIFVNIFFIGH